MEYGSKIGGGWQYTAYDKGNGRVFKRFNSYPLAFFRISRKLFPFIEYPLWNIPTYIESARRKATHSFRVLRSHNLPAEWFANIEKMGELDYEQDKVIPLKQVMDNANPDDSFRVIDQFIEFNQNLLEKGVMDKYFNISTNFGLDAKGNIVLLDIGDLLDDKNLILQQRKDRVWNRKYILSEISNPSVKKYFVDHMDAYFGIR